MRTFSEICVVTVNPFRGTTTLDKNGLPSVILICDAGKMPNRNVLAGTVAQQQGLEIGKTYVVQVRETGVDKVFGPAFAFTRIGEALSPVEAIDAIQKVGPAEILVVDRPEGFEKVYHRKGDAVESLQTKRIKEGQFIPSTGRRSYSHETASAVKPGSTWTGATDEQKNLKEEDLHKKEHHKK